MRVLTVTASVSRHAGGLFDAVRRMNQSLVDLGVTPEVFALADSATPEDAPRWAPITPRTFRRIGPQALGYSPELTRGVARAAGPGAVIHLHGLWQYPSQAARRASQRTGTPRVVSPHGMMDRWALARSKWKKRLVGLWYEYDNLRSAQCLHALCEAERQSLREFGLRAPIAVIPNGVDLPEPPATSDRPTPSAMPREWRDRRLLLFLGRVHPKKGILPLLEAWKASANRLAQWVLAIAGPDEVGHAAEVQARVGELGLTECCRLVGPQFGPEKEAWLRRADAFVLPSHSEGFSMAILEAMGYGLPVLMTPECNFPEAEKAGAAISRPATPAALASGLAELAALSSEAGRAIGARGRELVARNYTWSKVAEQFFEVYTWLGGAGPMPPTVTLD